MFASVLAVATIVGLPISAFAAPSPRASAVNCTIVDLAGANFLYLHDGTTTASMPGITPDYLLSDAIAAAGSSASAGNNPQVLINSAPFQGDNFGFEACTSSYMGFPSYTTAPDGRDRWYGHIRAYTGYGSPVSGDPLCVNKRYVEYGVEFLTAEACSYDDDASQEGQWFTTVITHEEYEGNQYYLGLIGQPNGVGGKQYYYSPGTDAAPAIAVHPETDTGYRLGIEYLHYN